MSAPSTIEKLAAARLMERLGKAFEDVAGQAMAQSHEPIEPDDSAVTLGQQQDREHSKAVADYDQFLSSIFAQIDRNLDIAEGFAQHPTSRA